MNLFEKSKNGDISILLDPLVDKVKNDWEETPLHYLADKGMVEVLNHPSVDKVINKWGSTPLHILANYGKVSKKWIRKKYPWYKKEFKKTNRKLIEDILNTPHSMRFINE